MAGGDLLDCREQHARNEKKEREITKKNPKKPRVGWMKLSHYMAYIFLA